MNNDPAKCRPAPLERSLEVFLEVRTKKHVQGKVRFVFTFRRNNVLAPKYSLNVKIKYGQLLACLVRGLKRFVYQF